MEKLKQLLQKHQEILLYALFGCLTTIVSVGSFLLFDKVLHIHELVANVLSWVLAVGVAYGTNRRWVFHSKTTGHDFWIETFAFYGGRLMTLGLEEGLLLIFATWLMFDSLLVKVATQILVLTGNYILSKFLIFRKKTAE